MDLRQATTGVPIDQAILRSGNQAEGWGISCWAIRRTACEWLGRHLDVAVVDDGVEEPGVVGEKGLRVGQYVLRGYLQRLSAVVGNKWTGSARANKKAPSELRG
eukprot:1189246-Prorocentrum_minimum.AAC.2